MSVSIGVAPANPHADLRSVTDSADQALRRAKAHGRNQTILAT